MTKIEWAFAACSVFVFIIFAYLLWQDFHDDDNE